MKKEIRSLDKNRQFYSQNTFIVVISSNHRAGPGRAWSFPPIMYESYNTSGGNKSQKHGPPELFSHSVTTSVPVELCVQRISD